MQAPVTESPPFGPFVSNPFTSIFEGGGFFSVVAEKRKTQAMSSLCVTANMKLFLSVLAVFSGLSTTAASLPLSDCYALSKENYLYDFTDKIGKELELEGELSDFVLRFCVDAQNRSSSGYVNYGRFLPESMFKHQYVDVDFFQEYKYGDLRLCEHNGNEFMGRQTEVRIVCGNCPNNETPCTDEFGCICSATYQHNSCKAKVLAAIDCGRRGPRIPLGFKIGFQPRGWHVVRNGMTQREFRKPFHNFSFETHQKSVSLYMTSTLGLGEIGKPQIQMQPPEGLSVEIVSKAAMTKPSETEAMALLEVNWKCEKSRKQAYEVNVKVPIDGYDPVEFFLCKECKNYETQKEAGTSSLKMFGVFSLIFLFMIALFGLLGITHKFILQNKGESDEPLISESLEEVPHNEDAAERAIEVPMV